MIKFIFRNRNSKNLWNSIFTAVSAPNLELGAKGTIHSKNWLKALLEGGI